MQPFDTFPPQYAPLSTSLSPSQSAVYAKNNPLVVRGEEGYRGGGVQ